MTPWLLLIGTVLCAYATSVASRSMQRVNGAPFSSIRRLWKGGLYYLSVTEKERLQQYMNRDAAHTVFVMCAMATVFLAVQTARAFFPWL